MEAWYAPLKERILARLEAGESVLLGIDGPCAAGKTTLAGLLQAEFSCTVLHMDDFFLPPERKTKARLEMPGGNVDWERFYEEVLQRLSRGARQVTYRPYSCQSGALLPPVTAVQTPLTVVEGSYSLHPELRPCYGLTCMLRVSPEVQLDRLRRRDPALLDLFVQQWIPLEERYFSAFDLYRQCDLCLESKE